MHAVEVFELFRVGLKSMPLSLLWRGYGSAIFLEFGELSPNGRRRNGSERHPFGQFSIGIEGSWRIEGETSIVCGSWSNEELWEPSFDLIRDRILQSIHIYSRILEIDLTFDNGHHMLSFNTADDQPAWFIIDRRIVPSVTLLVDQGSLAIE